MRREVKLGIFVTLSASLFVAVLVGRAISNGGAGRDENLALNDSPDAAILEAADDAALESALPTGGPHQPVEDEAEALLNEIAGRSTSPDDEMEAVFKDIEDDSGGDWTEEILYSGAELPPPHNAGREDLPAEELAEAPASVDPAEELTADIDRELAEKDASDKLTPPVAATRGGRLPEDETVRKLAEVVDRMEAEDTKRRAEAAKFDVTDDNIVVVERSIAGKTPLDSGVYVVKSGDTLWDISKAVYGTPVHHKKIAGANPSINPNLLSVGVRLVIPMLPADKKATAEKPSAGIPAAGSAAGEKNAPGRTYVIKPGDRLWDISKKHYGKSTEWKRIIEANPDVNPNNLTVGQEIVIP